MLYGVQSEDDALLANGDDALLANEVDALLANGDDALLANGDDALLANGDDAFLANEDDALLANGDDAFLANEDDALLTNDEGSLLEDVLSSQQESDCCLLVVRGEMIRNLRAGDWSSSLGVEWEDWDWIDAKDVTHFDGAMLNEDL